MIHNTGRLSIIASILGFGILLSSTFALPELLANYIVNGNFETDSGDTSPWFGVNGSYTLITEGTNQYCRTTPGTVMAQDLDVKGLQDADFVELAGTARTSAGQACIDIVWKLKGGTLKTDTVTCTSKDWTGVNGDFQVPKGFQSVQVRLRFTLLPGVLAPLPVPLVADFDDISLQK